MKPYVQTVLNKKSVSEIGFSQCHEHLFIAAGKPSSLNKFLQINDYNLTKIEVEEFKKNGGTLLVDAQPLGCGRMEENLVRLSKQTGVDIVASTGFHRLDFYEDNHWIFKFDETELADIFISEAQDGMFVGTDQADPKIQLTARAGMIKTAVSPNGIEFRNEKMFRASAEAQRQTGLPIMIHMEKGVDPFQVIQYFEERSVPLNALIICHLDRTHHDYYLHKEILATGVFVEYDTIGRFKYHDDTTEALLIENMIEAGFVRQILLSLDTTQERLGTYGGSIGLSYLLKKFLPYLKERGCPDSTIDILTVENPKQALLIGKEIERKARK
ncbi:phosphotriesterase family protein [Lederbergia citrea]|uniref:Aryldialkylphosphatase n=1 Tax=Lederbergia citrea TaxID=2833581 RepID=A0A942UMP6_9BACI|nr:hypothetical protein [Lederbergia citrea]MBS4221741.1 hypothetical protein [Lederbergia citrea]